MINILSVTNTITIEQSKTNLNHSFVVDKHFKSLLVKFSYFPKKMENREKALDQIKEAMAIYAPKPFDKSYGELEGFLPIVNLLTVSVDAPDGYRGCAHRHAPTQEHILSNDFASAGFYKGKILKGQWQVVINAHCVASDICTYIIEVYGEEC